MQDSEDSSAAIVAADAKWKTAGTSTLALGLVISLLVGCGSDSSTLATAGMPATSANARTGADAYDELQHYTALGLHRTGTDGGQQVVNWLAGRLAGFGLDPQIEPFPFNQFVPQEATLRLDDGSTVKSFPYWYSGLTGRSGITAELVDVGSGAQARFDAQNLSGKLILANIQLHSRALFSNLDDVMRRAHAAGAAGVVAAIQAPDNLIVAANAESEAGLCGLPVLFVGAEDGRNVRKHVGKAVTFTLAADDLSGESANVVATIAGRSSDTLIIGTPVNGWFATASERGGGVGTLLTLARYYAERVAQTGARPDKTLVFVFTGGHEVGFLGLQRYIDAHADVIGRTYTYVHLGAAIAGTYYYKGLNDQTNSVPIADPARTLYVSENPLLQRLVSTRQLLTGLSPIQTVRPSVNNPGEQRRMYARGVPIVSISGTTLFFHTEADTPETTSADLLEPVVQFYGAVIDDLLEATPASVLANNRIAAGFAEPLPVPSCVVPAT